MGWEKQGSGTSPRSRAALHESPVASIQAAGLPASSGCKAASILWRATLWLRLVPHVALCRTLIMFCRTSCTRVPPTTTRSRDGQPVAAFHEAIQSPPASPAEPRATEQVGAHPVDRSSLPGSRDTASASPRCGTPGYARSPCLCEPHHPQITLLKLSRSWM